MAHQIALKEGSKTVFITTSEQSPDPAPGDLVSKDGITYRVLDGREIVFSEHGVALVCKVKRDSRPFWRRR